MINSRVTSLNKSATLKLTALTKKLKAEGKDVVNFAAGEPDFDTPQFVKEEAKKAIDLGFTKYTPSCGTAELRDAISKKLVGENNIQCSAKNIITTAGAKYAIFAALMALLSEGDEVLLPGPFWVSYPEMVGLLGAKCTVIPTTEKTHFKLTPELLRKAITPKTKLLILNYPCNPTGATYNAEELKLLLEVISKHDMFVLSDEIYEKLIYDNAIHTSFASLPGAHDRTVTINGFSKSFSMTGWRLGYLEAKEDLVEEISKIIDHTTSCTSSISQAAAMAALNNKTWIAEVRREFQKRRNLLWNNLHTEKKIIPIRPDGTFYMLCDIRATKLPSARFASLLLEQYLVSTIPTDTFGAEGYVRLSFATSTKDILTGIERIKTFLNRL